MTCCRQCLSKRQSTSLLWTETTCLNAALSSLCCHCDVLQGVPLEETKQHVAAMVEGLRGRQGSKYAALLASREEAA